MWLTWTEILTWLCWLGALGLLVLGIWLSLGRRWVTDWRWETRYARNCEKRDKRDNHLEN